MGRTAVGGTFEYLHDGHRQLIKKAFEIAGSDVVDIGLTSDAMAREKQRDIPPYNDRRTNLISYLEELNVPKERYNIRMLNDAFGTTITDDYENIVVSPETYSVALKINSIRKKTGRPQIRIINIDYVMADDNIPISSTRISHGDIDVHGHLRNSRQE